MLILLKITFHRSYMKCSHWLFLRVVSQVIEDFFSSFMRIQNVLKLACNISDGKKKKSLQEKSHAPSIELPAGPPRPSARGRNTCGEPGQLGAGGGRSVASATRAPHSARPCIPKAPYLL